MRRTWILSSLAIIGCSSSQASKPAAPTAPTANAAPPANVAPKSASLPPELAALAEGGALEAGPFAWPPGGTSAVVGDADRTKLVWQAATGKGAIDLPRAVANAALKDVTKDGTPELVVFAKPPASAPQWFEDQAMTWIVGIAPKTKQPARMWLLEMQVIGATDDASLDKQLETVGSFASDPNPIRTIARLGSAKPDELKALVGAPGVKVCKRQGEKKSCKTIAQKAIDAKTAKQIATHGGGFAEYAPSPDATDYDALQPASCQPDEKNSNVLNCSASVGGPAGGGWTFEKTAGGLRLSEVWSWAEDS